MTNKRAKAKRSSLKGAPAGVLEAFNRLKDKQKAFAMALPTAESQKEAARLAGYAESTAKSLAFKLAQNPDVQRVVGWLQTGVDTGVPVEEQAAAAEVIVEARDTLEATVRELCRITMLDPRSLFDDNGNLLPIKEWPDDAARAVASIESYEEYQGRGADRVAVGMVRKVKFHPKIEGINTLSRIKGWFRPERFEHDLTDPLTKLLAQLSGSALPIVQDPPSRK